MWIPARSGESRLMCPMAIEMGIVAQGFEIEIINTAQAHVHTHAHM
jgi:hypothetical protein